MNIQPTATHSGWASRSVATAHHIPSLLIGESRWMNHKIECPGPHHPHLPARESRIGQGWTGMAVVWEHTEKGKIRRYKRNRRCFCSAPVRFPAQRQEKWGKELTRQHVLLMEYRWGIISSYSHGKEAYASSDMNDNLAYIIVVRLFTVYTYIFTHAYSSRRTW